MATKVEPGSPDIRPGDAESLVDLARRGVLVGVQVFGAESFGLCDVFGPTSVGSDCNRAERWLMRPVDSLATDALREALTDDSSWWTPPG